MIERSEIEWKGVRKDGLVARGTQRVGRHSIEWLIKKSPAGLCYELHLDTIGSKGLAGRPTILQCKQYAEEYF